jgi:palmitoyltransferase ZDHHC13/17
MTTAVPLTSLFMSEAELSEALSSSQKKGDIPSPAASANPDDTHDISDAMRSMMDDLGMNMSMLKNSNLFTGDEERFAFARALSRLSEMGSQEWVERGLGMEERGGREEMEGWKRVRSRWREDSL